jgi:lipase maturation factor 1
MKLFEGSAFLISQWLFLKLVAFNYFLAFWSLYVQVLGLYGSKGILPIKDLLEKIAEGENKKTYFKVPTIFWFCSKDLFLQFTAAFGMIVSFLIITEIFNPPILFFLLWVGYLSFVSVGMNFLGFQWDALLLEIGFIAIFFSIQSPPPPSLILLLWILLFRLMISSGVVKFLSKCPEWYNFNAMNFHYITQPLPNRIAYYAHKQRKSFSRISVAVVFFLEIIVPFFIFTPDNVRGYVFVLFVGFQLLLFATGNFAFFNTLTIALCVPLLSDSQLGGILENISLENNFSGNNFTNLFLNAFSLVFILLNALEFIGFFRTVNFVKKIMNPLSHLCLINRYGLFARMTTTRNEIIVEGSMDGIDWVAYEFKWKPGDLKSPPRQVAPYHPRLDWQMWFAALGSYQSNPWLIAFIFRLLEGSPEVTSLLKINPFRRAPPKYIRCQLWNYQFSDLKTKNETGNWWIRKYRGIYLPPVTLINDGITSHKLAFVN